VTDDHLSLDELAELDEGLLPPERISAIRAHLHGCVQCTARADAITSTRSMLAGLPDERMPDDIAARLSAALAEAAPAAPEPRQPTPGDTGDGPAGDDEFGHGRSTTIMPNVTEISTRRRGFGRPTAAASAAAAAVVLALGAIVVAHYHHQHGSPAGLGTASELAPSSPGDVISPDQPSDFYKSSTDQNYTVATLSTLVPGLVGSAVVNGAAHRNAATGAPSPTTLNSLSTSSGAGAAAGGSGAGGTTATSGTTGTSGATGTSGTTASGGQAGGAAPTTTTTSKSAPKATSVTPAVPTNGAAVTLEQQPIPKPLRALATSHEKLLTCAAALTGRADAVPLEIDFGYWTNGDYVHAPSAIFVFKGTTPSTVAVFVVSPTCGDPLPVYDYTVVTLPN
jgi:hypothetical protein